MQCEPLGWLARVVAGERLDTVEVTDNGAAHALEPRLVVAREPLVSLLERGMINAIAYVRDRQEIGRSWYDGCRLLNKKNSFTDFIAVAEALIARIERFDAQTRAFITPTFDLARRQARDAEQRIVASGPRGSVYDPAGLPPDQAWPAPCRTHCSSIGRPPSSACTMRAPYRPWKR